MLKPEQTALEHARSTLAEQVPGGKLIFLALTGSRAYGTSHEDSDWDFKGVYIAPLRAVLDLGKEPGNISIPGDYDMTLYELRHFCKLAADANPTVLELLWSPWTWQSWEGLDLIRQRQIFLSTKIKYTYGGYAREQLRKAREGSGGSRGVNHFKREKFVLHTLRLLHCGRSALTAGEVVVQLSPDTADRLKLLSAHLADDIDGLEMFVESEIDVLDRAASQSSLKDFPDYAAINTLIYSLRTEGI